MRVYLSDGKTQTQYAGSSDAQVRVFAEGSLGLTAVYMDDDGRPLGNVILAMSPEDALLLAARIVNQVAHIPKGGS